MSLKVLHQQRKHSQKQLTENKQLIFLGKIEKQSGRMVTLFFLWIRKSDILIVFILF